ncbi:hypothetical protein BVRB_1g001870 [Beta vulgaris subsp. vulgaris]|nr:hypothetical protein BVRB_1g001870 [Beta vulgaris subsp. vulgaris]
MKIMSRSGYSETITCIMKMEERNKKICSEALTD